MVYPPKFLHVYELEGPAPQGITHPDLMGIWQEGGYSFVFFGSNDQIPLQIELEGTRMYHVFRYEDWLGGSLGKIMVGRFTVIPVWDATGPKGAYDLILDPNVVFGSGQHPTTFQCLSILGNYQFKVQNAIDLGTGTGILAIAMGKMGIRVKAIDNNPLCVEVSKKNVLLNGLEDLIEVTLGDVIKEPLDSYELIVANLGPDLIVKLMERLDPIVNQLLLLSGITRSFVSTVLGQAKAIGYSLIVHEDDGTWHTLFFGREKHG